MTRLPIVLLILAVLFVSACGGGKGSEAPKAPALKPSNPAAINTMAKGVAAAKDPRGTDRAIALFRQAVNEDAQLWEARYNLGVLLTQVGDLDGAEKQLAEAVKLSPNAEDVVVALAEVRRRNGNAEGAISVLEPFVASHADALLARVALVSALREGGRIDDAIHQAHEVLVRRASDPNALAELALSHLEQGEVDTAELLSQEALKAKPESAIAQRTAGLIALERGDDAVAFRHFARASEIDPSDATARLNMGTVLLQAGVYKQAGEHFKAVLEVKPNDAAATLGLAAAMRGLGNRDNPAPFREVERILKSFLEGHPRNAAALYNLAVLYSDYMQQPAQAKVLYERFLSEAPGSHPARDEASKALAALAATKQ